MKLSSAAEAGAERLENPSDLGYAGKRAIVEARLEQPVADCFAQAWDRERRPADELRAIQK